MLPYEVVRSAPAPDAALLEFLQSTYEAAADFGAWDRAALERNHDAGDHRTILTVVMTGQHLACTMSAFSTT
jgi:hypothetical protein